MSKNQQQTLVELLLHSFYVCSAIEFAMESARKDNAEWMDSGEMVSGISLSPLILYDECKKNCKHIWTMIILIKKLRFFRMKL